MNKIREEDINHVIFKLPFKMFENSTFLITGANGFLASYMVDVLMHLKSKGLVKKCSVIALCRNRKKAEHTFKEWMNEENFHILIQPVEERVCYKGRIDYIIHAASCSTTSFFDVGPVDLMKSNIIGCYNFLEFAREKQIKGFLFFSSGAVYGETTTNQLYEDKIYALDYLDMKNSYACGKRAGEALCRAYWHQYKVPTKCVRISHTYGPGININDGHVYSDFAKSIIENKNIVIKGDGHDSRPFCYISDAIYAFYLILFYGKNGEMYNMANSDATLTIKELADLLAYKVFPERNLDVVIEKKYIRDDVQKILVNTEKLEKLGWKPLIGVEEGFKRLIESLENDYEMEKQRT